MTIVWNAHHMGATHDVLYLLTNLDHFLEIEIMEQSEFYRLNR